MAQTKKISSFKAFHELVPKIVEQFSHDDALSIRALANPLLAFEELGYRLAPEVQKKVERILLYPPATRKQLQTLEKEIHDIAGEVFDVDDEQALDKLLFKKLKLTRPNRQLAVYTEKVVEQGADFVKGRSPAWSDPLIELEKDHAIIPPLLSYRKLRAERPGFAPRELYQQLVVGSRKLPVSNIRITFPGLHEDYDDA